MKRIVYPMKVLAVKIEYRRQLLEKMVHGHVTTRGGKKCFAITYDPERPSVNSRIPRYIRVDSKLGLKLSTEVNAYLSIKAEYDNLVDAWYSLYDCSPPRVVLPIVQYADPHGMNNEFFKSQKDCCGRYIPDNPTVSEHGQFKSKNEQIGADLLNSLDIPFKYEPEVYLGSIGEMINPDFLIDFYEIDRCAYLEILGMNDKANYSINTATKINGFCRDVYRPGREVIYVILYDKHNFDEKYFVSQVLSAFNDMIPDEALIWESVNKAI